MIQGKSLYRGQAVVDSAHAIDNPVLRGVMGDCKRATVQDSASFLREAKHPGFVFDNASRRRISKKKRNLKILRRKKIYRFLEAFWSLC